MVSFIAWELSVTFVHRSWQISNNVQNLIITARQQCCRRVMFLVTSVILFRDHYPWCISIGTPFSSTSHPTGIDFGRRLLKYVCLAKRASCTLLECFLVTARVAKRAKVIFSKMCVTHFVHGGSGCPGQRGVGCWVRGADGLIGAGCLTTPPTTPTHPQQHLPPTPLSPHSTPTPPID